jgi:hypothetical protein
MFEEELTKKKKEWHLFGIHQQEQKIYKLIESNFVAEERFGEVSKNLVVVFDKICEAQELGFDIRDGINISQITD